MKNLLCIVLLLASVSSLSQNILHNGSFEPQVSGSYGWTSIGSVDGYYGSYYGNIGSMYPKDGMYYRGLRFLSSGSVDDTLPEYLVQNVHNKFIADQRYKVSIHYCLADMCTLTTDDFGVAFIEDPFFFGQAHVEWALGAISPAVKLEDGNFVTNDVHWQNLTGYYVATGDERFVVIGSFKMDHTIDLIPISCDYAHCWDMAYFFVDHFEIIPCIDYPEVDLIDTVVVCDIGTVGLDATSYTSATYAWSNGETTAQAQAYIDHSQYVSVEITNNGCTFKDSIYVRLFNRERGPAGIESCDDSVLPVSIELSVEPGEYILWDDGSSYNKREFEESGSYSYERKLEHCSFKDTFNITIWEDDLLLFPNPGLGVLNFSDLENLEILSVTSADGKLIHSGSISLNELNLLMQGLQPGTYLINVLKNGCRTALKYERTEIK